MSEFPKVFLLFFITGPVDSFHWKRKRHTTYLKRSETKISGVISRDEQNPVKPHVFSAIYRGPEN